MSETHYSQPGQTLLVVNLVGPLTKKNIAVFEDCRREVLRSQAKWIVLNFRDVPGEMDPEYFTILAEFRQDAQARSAQVRFSGVHPSLRKVLEDRKVAEQNELSNNLAEALQSFPVREAA